MRYSGLSGGKSPGLLLGVLAGVEMSAARIRRRAFLVGGAVLLLGGSAGAAGKPAVTVYKEPT